MTGILLFCAGVLVGFLLRPRLKSVWDYLKSAWGE